jgi:hypothetical protein
VSTYANATMKLPCTTNIVKREKKGNFLEFLEENIVDNLYAVKIRVS